MSAKPEPAPASTPSSLPLMAGILIAIVLGTLVGGLAPQWGRHTAILGDVFISALKMLVVPLVLTSLIAGIASLGDLRNLGSMGWRTLLYYTVTTGLAVLCGLILVNLIKPGSHIAHGEKLADAAYQIEEDGLTVTLPEARLDGTGYPGKFTLTLLDREVTGLVAEATAGKIRVVAWDPVAAKPAASARGTGIEVALPIAGKVRGKENRTLFDIVYEVILGDKASGKQGMIAGNIFQAMVNMDVLPLIVFALLFGAALASLGEAAKPAIAIFCTLNDAVMKIVGWLMLAAPLGIFGLIAARISSAGGFAGFWPELQALGRYAFTVILGLAVHGIVILPAILRIFGRRSPVAYARGMATPLLNAFSTASSSATLPLTMEACEKNNGITNRIASVVLPLGATINMDGTALYEAVAAMFIAQVYGIELGIAAQTIIFLTATLAAIGAAGIPEAGLVTMVIVLKAVNLPIEGIALILAIDWFLDRCRTTVNVWGDAVGAAVVQQAESRKILPIS